MIIIPKKYIYLATPRSASRTITYMLQLLGFRSKIAVHPSIEVVTAAREEHKLPTITMLRDPAHILFSFWWARAERSDRSFSDYIRDDFNGIFAPVISGVNGRKKGPLRRIYPYHGVTDEYFLYTDGVEAFIKYLGLPERETISTGILDKRPDHAQITEEHRQLITEYFPKDVAIWEANRNEQRS